MRPRVLLVPNTAGWILGEIARQIILTLGPEYDFYLLTPSVLRRRGDLLRRLLCEVDFVHAMDPSSASFVLDRNQTAAAPLLTWIHHLTTWSPRHAAVARGSQMLLTSTERWRETIRGFAPDVPVEVVGYGVDVELYRRRPADRRRFRIPARAFAVGFLGSHGSDHDQGRKGLDTLGLVLAEVQRAIPRLHVCFGGPGWEGTARSLRAGGISAECVGFLPQSRLPDLYSSLDAYLMTSRVEGGPCTVLEAMACEVPVVATQVGLVPDVIQDGQNGHTAQPGDVSGLAAGLMAIAGNPEAARELGRRGRESVVGREWRNALRALRGPYARMTEIARRRRRDERCLLPHPARLLRAGAAADAMVHSASLVRIGELSLPAGLQMLAVLCQDMRARDVLSGLGLLSGLTFRAA